MNLVYLKKSHFIFLMVRIGEGGRVLIVYLQVMTPADYPYDYIFIYSSPLFFKLFTSILP